MVQTGKLIERERRRLLHDERLHMCEYFMSRTGKSLTAKLTKTWSVQVFALTNLTPGMLVMMVPNSHNKFANSIGFVRRD